MNLIIHGDAKQELANLPKTFGLIFTDPIYQNLEDYLWLEQVASQHLKPGGNIFAYQSSYYLARTLKKLETELPVLNCIQQTNGNLAGNTIAKTYHVIWMGAGKLPARGGKPTFILDGYVSNTWAKVNDYFKWVKNPLHVKTLMEAATLPGDTVLDTFCGSGTIAAVAKALGRSYVAIDRDRDCVTRTYAALSDEQQAILKTIFKRADDMRGKS